MIGMLMEQGLATIFREEATGERDPLGRPVVDRVPHGPYPGRLEQDTTSEGEGFVVDKWRLFLPTDTDIRPADEVEARGQRYTVEGTPSVERIPGFSALSNIAATLRYVGPVSAS